jgi:hypothetical protein
MYECNEPTNNWEDYLPLVEFGYNNSYQSSKKMTTFNFLYGRPCITPLSWDRIEDVVLIGPKRFKKCKRK